MTLLNHYKQLVCAGALFALAGALPANAMNQEDFNVLVIKKGCTQSTGCKETVNQAAQDKTTLRDIARMALDPSLKSYQYCILEGVASNALADGMSPQAIFTMLQGVEGLNPSVFLAAMVRSGISEDDVKILANEAKISELVSKVAFSKAKEADVCSISPDDTLAYTPAENAAPMVIGGLPINGGSSAPSGTYTSPSTFK